jgi:hypothetical protein
VSVLNHAYNRWKGTGADVKAHTAVAPPGRKTGAEK